MTKEQEMIAKLYAMSPGVWPYHETAAMIEALVKERDEWRRLHTLAEKTRDAAVLALETEHGVATTYAKQVAYWIEKHDALRSKIDNAPVVAWIDDAGKLIKRSKEPSAITVTGHLHGLVKQEDLKCDRR